MFSTHKEAVFKKLDEVKNEIDHPGIVSQAINAVQSGVNPEQKSYEIRKTYMEQSKNLWDPLFLFDTFSASKLVSDSESNMARDVVGKEAVSQLAAFVAGGIETLCLAGALYFDNKAVILLCLAVCYATDQLEASIDKDLKAKNFNLSQNGLGALLEQKKAMMNRVKTDPVQTLTSGLSSHIKEITTSNSLLSSAVRIAVNPLRFWYSNAVYVYNKLENNKTTQEEKNSILPYTR